MRCKRKKIKQLFTLLLALTLVLSQAPAAVFAAETDVTIGASAGETGDTLEDTDAGAVYLAGK